MDRRAFLTGAAAMGLGAAAHNSAFAQPFPSNVIRTIVPGSVSTPPDILARIAVASARCPTAQQGWNVIVEDKPGAMVMLGAGDVLKQPAGGHTLFLRYLADRRTAWAATQRTVRS